MSDQALMTEIISEIMKVTDSKCLETIQTTAFSRARDLRQRTAQVKTASWIVGDDVRMLPKHRGRKPYGANGKIIKINQVKIRVDFGNGLIYNVPKTMLMTAE